uniref:Nitric oxide synthase-interacting protein zinc-finger domain-containing protein n=2 Tax=Lotharella globosa TaxID=91324 RepID=A0A7S4DED9_9EUKA
MRAAWEKEQQEKATEEAFKASEEEQAKIQQFIKDQESVSRKRKNPSQEKKDVMKKFLYAPKKAGEIMQDPKSKEEKQKDLQRTSFWLPEFTPAAKKQKVEAPPKRPPSPFSRRPLRLKDLVPIKLKVLEGTSGREAKFVCQVSGKQITYQDTVFLRNTGVVMLKKCYDELAKPTMTCPVTGKKFKKKHAILIKNDGTGFASTGNVIAKQWGEALMN